MRHLQRFVLCLLCAALPLRGGAQMLDVPAPCPMSQSQAMAPATDGTGADACCEHGDLAGGTGTACETGQGCHCGGPGMAVAAFAAAVQRPPPALQPLPARLLMAACHPSAVWRPPTLI